MHADPEERLAAQPRHAGLNLRLIVAAAIALTIIGLVFFSGDGSMPEAEKLDDAPAPTPAAVVKLVQPDLPPAADIPQIAPAEAPSAAQALTAPTLTAENTDAELRKDFAQAGATDSLAAVMQSNDLVQRGASVVEGLSRGILLRKALPISPPAEKFATVTIDKQLYMDPASYHRYDHYAEAIAALDTQTLAMTFHRFRPFFETAYSELGLPGNEFDNAVIRSLDRILATPELDQTIPVTPAVVGFRYLDPELEGLSGIQKQLLRMGPKNIAMIKEQARRLRELLLEPGG